MSNASQGFRLSPQQRHLWLLQEASGNGAYVAQCAVLIEGVLDAARLETVLTRISERHEIVRTTFRRLPGVSLPLQVIDGKPPHWQTTGGRFDLEQGPVLRAHLIALEPSRHELLIELPALCADVVGLDNLVAELARGYGSLGEELADDPVQYVDLAQILNELLESPDAEEGRAFWRRQVTQDALAAALPFEMRNGTAGGRFSPCRLPFEISADVMAGARSFARDADGSMAAFFLACWCSLLFRLTGQVQSIGASCDGRNYEDLEDALGLFARYLPLRVALTEDLRFKDAMARVGEQEARILELQEHFSWDDLAEAGSHAGERRFFPFCFEAQPPLKSYRAGAVSFMILHRQACIDRYRVKLQLAEAEGAWRGEILYDASVLSAEAAACLARQLGALAASAAKDPDIALGALELMDELERRRLLFAFNDTYRELPETCVHDLFSDRARSAPEARAVLSAERSLTFGELEEGSNRLARFLSHLGVGPDVPVALFLERRPELVIGLLGILKAGGAYLPLDVHLPAARLAAMLEDARPPIVLTTASLASALPPSAARRICLDAEWEEIARQSPFPSASGAAPDNLAYILYTSGSTGRPKGVMVTHRGLMNYLAWSAGAYPLEQGDGAPVHSPLGFDLTVTSLFPPLLKGRPVHLLPEAEGIEAMEALLRSTNGGFSLIKLTPAHLEALGRMARPSEAAGWTAALVVGGEALFGERLDFWRAHAPETRIFNEYGPTETVVGCCVHEVPPGALPSGPVPIGRPIANTRVYVLEDGLCLSPVGIPGELYVGGDGLARGYRNLPALTAERFVPDPFAAEPGARLYRTGDLVRHRPDGNLEFLGRADHQVKVRGFRIELGEIEAVLTEQPAIRQAVAVVREERSGDPRLVAYAVPAAQPWPPADALRDFLAQRLPAYMVPAEIILLESLPLTPNGKVDRRALPAAAAGPAVVSFVAPRTPVEQLLAGMWAELLGRERIGARDDFFALGGHSLLATQLLFRVRRVFLVELPVRDLFANSTLGSFAAAVEAAMRSGEESARPPIERMERTEAPLSFAQERLWFLAQLDPGSAAYNISIVLRIAGQLQWNALAWSLDEIVRRHEALRTSFPLAEGRPVQAIAPAENRSVPLADLTGLPPEVRERVAERLAAAEARRSFDLVRGPMLRPLLLRLGSGEHLLIVVTHNIVFDGSMDRFLREFAVLYGAAARRLRPPLAELPIQYADFARWQRSWLQGEILAQQLAYWQQQLSGSPPLLPLPTDRPRPGVQTFRGSARYADLPQGLHEEVEQLAARGNCTLYMTVLAAFTTLLHRYTGQEDILVGSPVADRPGPETEELIGCFVNTLVLRARFGGRPSFLGLLAQVRETVLEAFVRKDLPFEALVEALQPERSLSHTPLFQVMFVLQNAPVRALDLDLPGLTITRPRADAGAAKLDLLLSALGARAATVEYNTDLFDPVTIDRLLGHLGNLLQAAAAGPERSVASLPLLDEAERFQVLREWNDTAAGGPADLCLNEPFERWAAATPDAVAVVSDEETLSYRELNRRSNRLAHLLRELDVQRSSLVAVYLRRSARMAVAVMGIAKAGGAYVPLDPAFPPARVRSILDTLGIRWFVTESACLEIATQVAGDLSKVPHRICLDDPDLLESRKDRAEKNPAQKADPDDLAYVIFTSGSTGAPKGVMVQHRPAVHLIDWVNTTFGVGPGDLGLFVTSLGFDLSVYDLFGLLAAGGSIRVAADAAVKDPQRLVRMLCDEPITFWDSAPAAMRNLVPFLPPGPQPAGQGPRLVFLSGDWIPVALPDQIRAVFPEARIVSLGGATEATIWSNVYPVERVDPAWPSIPYGRPIRNARYHVLDEELAPVPIGVPGDLYIAGDCLATGYAGDPVLTAQKLAPDPFGVRRGDLLYRTGDRARYRADGNLEFLGRLDHQVKIRGFRVELGEIESNLREHPGLWEAVAEVRGGRGGEDRRRLVAYVVPHPGMAPAASELRSFLAQRLPEYMLPAVFVRLAELPVTANGKLDRSALPEPEPAAPEIRSRTSPRTATEEIVALLYAQTLGLESVGVHDHFFELGGHSLLATQMVARLSRCLGAEVPLQALFEAPTVAELSAYLDRGRAAGVRPPLERIAERQDMPLSFAQQRLWYIEQLHPGNALNVFNAVRIRGALETGALETALAEVVRRHEVLRTCFPSHGGRPVQRVLPSLPLPLPRVDLAALPEGTRQEELRRLAWQQALLPFRIDQELLLRIILLRMSETEHVVLLCVHHIVFDAWSIGILIREVAALYSAFVRGEPSPLPELPVQYADFARWQRQWLDGEELERQMTFWRERLGAGLPESSFPVDRPRQANRVVRGGKYPLHLPEPLTRSLKELGLGEGATLFMTLLASFQVLLGYASGQEDVVVGTNIANRNHAEVQDLIGFFVNQLLLRTDLSGDPGFRELLARIRRMTLDAYAHQDVPYEMLIEQLGPARNGRNALFRVKVELQNAPLSALELAGLSLDLVDIEHAAVRYDLHLSLAQMGGAVAGSLLYDADLYDEPTIALIAEQWMIVLEEIAVRPEVRLSELGAKLAEAERRQRRQRRDERKEANLVQLEKIRRRSAGEPLGTQGELAT